MALTGTEHREHYGKCGKSSGTESSNALIVFSRVKERCDVINNKYLLRLLNFAKHDSERKTPSSLLLSVRLEFIESFLDYDASDLPQTIVLCRHDSPQARVPYRQEEFVGTNTAESGLGERRDRKSVV